VLGIQRGTAVAITAGSFKEAFGTAAYVIQDSLDDPKCRFISVNQTPGRSGDHSPYRAEVGGILGIAEHLTIVCTKFGIVDGSILVSCDCSSGLTTIFDHTYVTPTQANSNLIHQTRLLLEQLPIEVSSKHIRGHQDDKRPLHHLTTWERINVEMDRIAKSYWQALQYYPKTHFDLPPNQQWSVMLNNHRLPSFLPW
jgi:hypothetical protein